MLYIVKQIVTILYVLMMSKLFFHSYVLDVLCHFSIQVIESIEDGVCFQCLVPSLLE